MRQVIDWKDYFIEIARTTALRSKDPKRQVGCVIVDPVSKTIRSGGYNGMVRGVVETDELWEQKELNWLCHAEANAVSNAARCGSRTEGCWLYVTRFPCLRCARLVVQAGITKIVTPDHSCNKLDGNEEDYRRVRDLMREVGVEMDGDVIFV